MESFTKSVAAIATLCIMAKLTEHVRPEYIKEHERGVSHFDQPYSKIAKHAEQYDHRIDFNIVNKTKNYRERWFLEAWYSLKDQNTGNDHIKIPDWCIQNIS